MGRTEAHGDVEGVAVTPPRTIGRPDPRATYTPPSLVERMPDGSRPLRWDGIDRRLYWSTQRRESAHASAVAAVRRLPVLSVGGDVVTGERARTLWAMTSAGVMLPY